ncbi:hypothetical protein ACHAW5_005355 [Stephanodiscus triporus]|uniref:Uncharacterized protein n=1 Tax=Stephanodiscus triporus TaxID=2934178 RepID=A0ABD3N6R3_9STRA
MPSEEGVPSWNEIHVVKNAAEKIALVKTEIMKRLKLKNSLLQLALSDIRKHNFQQPECRKRNSERNSEREAENYANGTSNFQQPEVIEKATKHSSEYELEKSSNGTHNFQLAKKESRAAATGGTGPWTDEEDRKLRILVLKHGLGYGTWIKIAKEIPGRNNNQCQTRWVRELDTQISKAPWSKEEYRIILQSQRNSLVKKWQPLEKQLEEKG